MSSPSPDRPWFGRPGIRWLRHHLAKFVLATPEIRELSTEERRMDLGREIVTWYLEDYRHYLVWTADQVYRGGGYSSWEVSVNWEAVRSDFSRALADCREWLADPGLAAAPPIPVGPIDVEAALTAMGVASVAPAEPRAYDLLKNGTRWSEGCNRLCLSQERVRRNTPRLCNCCGDSFLARKAGLINCDTCRAAGLKRCASCREVFSSKGRGPRKCERCRTQVLGGQPTPPADQPER